ncbi:DUF1822 family protein [Okeania sp. SIO2B3]|uniref:DUF1822 family protein n=1 Tax=Okeania sp. SIO2B3 TaxID=2607784 RepID=UPI0013BFF7F7|nr:DUF1822 family protein [Okeania sp. SIO2B3]NET45443.1 DUF1822 family protein [Okeania sp. SIO2B3]
MLSFDELAREFPEQIWIEISEEDEENALPNEGDYSNDAARLNAYLNSLCLNLLLAWFQEEEEGVQPLPFPKRNELPSVWEFVNGTAIDFGKARFVIIPSDGIDTDEFIIPGEWVDIPSWRGNYYLAVQVNCEDGWLRVLGYATHKQIKNEGEYDEVNRSYVLEREDLVEDLNVIFLMQDLDENELDNNVEALEALPTLSSTEVTDLVENLSQDSIYFPRLEVEYFTWFKALLGNAGWREQLYQLRLGNINWKPKSNLENIPVLSSFEYYEQTKFKLVDNLTRLKSFSQKLNLNKSIELIDRVLNNLQTQSFSIAVVGEFNRGKSTFINALLGQEILPSDVLPTTAAINRVIFGLTPSVKVVFKDGLETEVPIQGLKQYVTKLTVESEKKAISIQEVIIQHNIEYCRNNIEIFDTPGLNDEANMAEVTFSILPQVDAAIMVISAQSPFSQSEKDFLENKLLSSDLGRVIFIVNGLDYFSRSDADRIINYTKNKITDFILERAEEQYTKDSSEYHNFIKKIGKPKVFGISALKALKAKQTNQLNLLAQSRFSIFEKALEEFLTLDRAAILLQVPINRIIASATEILKTINLEESAVKMEQSKFLQNYDIGVVELEGIRNRKKEEMNLINQATENVKYRVQPLIYQLPIILKQAAETAIEETPIEKGEVRSKNILQENFSHAVTNAIQKVSRQFSEKIQTETKQGIDREVERLKDFVTSVDRSLNYIEMEFVDIEFNAEKKTTSDAQAITPALAAFTGLGGIWSGYRLVGVKGAAVGAGASVGTFIGTGILAGLFGITVGFPLVLATGIASIFAGDWLAKSVFTKEMERNFRANFKEAITKEIDKRLREKHLEQEISNLISEPFAALQQTLNQEVEALLDNTQNKLAQLRGDRERGVVLSEAKQRELEEIKAETLQILDNAQRLSQEILQIMNS